MGKKKIFFDYHYKRITDPIQVLHIKNKYPQFNTVIKSDYCYSNGFFQPRITSPKYFVEIKFKERKNPKVKITYPIIDENAPHRYSSGDLCLFYPKEWKWNKTRIVANTIFPWTANWILMYELWKDTGEWLAPGAHDSKKG